MLNKLSLTTQKWSILSFKKETFHFRSLLYKHILTNHFTQRQLLPIKGKKGQKEDRHIDITHGYLCTFAATTIASKHQGRIIPLDLTNRQGSTHSLLIPRSCLHTVITARKAWTHLTNLHIFSM